MKPSQATVRPIIQAVADERGVTYEDVAHTSRRVVVVAARREAWRRIYALGGYTYSGIAAAWGCHAGAVSVGVRTAGKTFVDALAPIVARVAQRHGFSARELINPGRRAMLCRARFAAFAECSEAGFSSTEIGRYFNRDHTTVLHGIAKHKARTALSPSHDLPVGYTLSSHSQEERTGATLAA